MFGIRAVAKQILFDTFGNSTDQKPVRYKHRLVKQPENEKLPPQLSGSNVLTRICLLHKQIYRLYRENESEALSIK